MHSGEEIRRRIVKVAEEIFGFDFNEYLSLHNSRSFWGLIIDNHERKYHPLFGEPPLHFLEIINSRFAESMAGYRVDVRWKDRYLIPSRWGDDPEMRSPFKIVEIEVEGMVKWLREHGPM